MKLIEVHPPHGFVRLDNSMGNDLSVVNNARVSFAKHSSTLEDRDVGLIKYLLSNSHGSPFESVVFRFNVRCPIFVAREIFRHRIGSFNEESLRYSPARLDGYVPTLESVRSQVGKPGAYTFEPVSEEIAKLTRKMIGAAYTACFAAYEELIEQGVAKELARVVLPLGIYTEFLWTLNARSLMNFLALRNSRHAQQEIREYAVAIEEFFAQVLPVTYAAFVECDRKVP